MDKITTHSEKETFDFARSYAKKLLGGEVIGLIGELGAGKTVFTKGLAAGLGVKENVNSPTFVLMKIYEIRDPRSIIRNLIHIDAYRLAKPEELSAIGAPEYFGRPDTVAIIEWADKIRSVLPDKFVLITIMAKDKKHRKINIKQLI